MGDICDAHRFIGRVADHHNVSAYNQAPIIVNVAIDRGGSGTLGSDDGIVVREDE